MGQSVKDEEIYYEPEEEEKSGRTFMQYMKMVGHHWIGLVICILIGLAAGVIYGRFIKKPKYQTSTEMMIVNTDSNGTVSTGTGISVSEASQKAGILAGWLTSDELAIPLAQNLVKDGFTDYELKTTDKDGNVTVSYDLVEVRKLYSVSIPVSGGSNATSIFVDVSVTAKTEDLAVKVANYVPDLAIQIANTKSSGIYSYLNKSIMKMADAYTADDKSTSDAVIAIVGMLIGAVVGAAYGIIRDLTDTKVNTKKELEELTGVKVIGMIPNYIKEDDRTPAPVKDKKEAK